MVKKINTTTVAERTFFEGGSGGGGGSAGGGGSGYGSGSGNEDKGKGKEDPHAGRDKSVEDSSTKGKRPQEKQHKQSGSRRDKGTEDSGRDMEKGKQVMQSSDEGYYYQGQKLYLIFSFII